MTTVLLVALAFVAGLHVQHRRQRTAVAEVADRAAFADYCRDAADRLAVELDEARHAVTTLRAVVADQAVLVRRALGRPQKRRIPAGAR